MFSFRKKRKWRHAVDPDEIFLDAKNIPGFNTQQFEGVVEKPITKRTFMFVGVLFTLVIAVFVGRLGFLQVVHGERYFSASENNRLHQVPIFPERGIIYDRKGAELAWNKVGEEGEPFYYRDYINKPGFGHLLGYVRYPKTDSSGFFWRLDLEGVAGVEGVYNTILKGKNGLKLVETDATLKPQSESVTNPPVDGENFYLSIDEGVQSKLAESIGLMSKNFDYHGGAGIIMNIHNGEILAITNYPEYDGEVMSLGKDAETIGEYLNSSSNFFLNRAAGGLYTPGSIVKPFIALGALEEGVITPEKEIMSTGTIEIPNPYNRDEPSIFKDWRPHGHGPTNVYHAIADSVNTYFYSIGGGYHNQKGIGIAGIEKYTRLFGLASPTGFALDDEPEGTIPSPSWKEKVFKGDPWRLGDTYNSVIGQYGFQVTPLEMVRAVAGMANNGGLVTPTVVRDGGAPATTSKQMAEISPENFKIIQDAMRQTVTAGTAGSLNVSYVHVAAKTGSAQVGVAKNRINAWSIGFFPYEHPQYAYAIVMEKGPAQDSVGASWAMRQLFDWMSQNTPEYFE